MKQKPVNRPPKWIDHACTLKAVPTVASWWLVTPRDQFQQKARDESNRMSAGRFGGSERPAGKLT